MILRAGLTGGIASGKSTVGRIFARLGAQVIDADAIVAALYRPGEAGYEAIVRRYGEAVLHTDGEIDRAALSAIALATAESAAELNAMIHPLVIAEEARMIETESTSSQDGIVIVEATLLLESGGRERYQRIIVVDLDPETQIDRAVARGLDRNEAKRRMARQMSREERLRQADYVIDNRGTAEQTIEQTREVYAELGRDLEKMRA
jgi:dephospho-CoA kinase